MTLLELGLAHARSQSPGEPVVSCEEPAADITPDGPSDSDSRWWAEVSGAVEADRQMVLAEVYRQGRVCGYAGRPLAVPAACSDPEMEAAYGAGYERGEAELEVDQAARDRETLEWESADGGDS